MPSDTRSPDEIERGLEVERARLGNTIDSLHEKMSVESITGEVTEQLKSAGGDALLNVSERVMENARANPAAVALAGAGLLWLVVGQSKTQPSNLGEVAAFPANRPRPVAPPKPAAPERNDPVTSLRDWAMDLRQRIAEGTEGLTEEGKARVIAAREAAAASLDATVEGAKSRARSAFSNIEDNPWIYGGIAIALGAAVGGAVVCKQSEEKARAERQEVFAEADRIWRDEVASASRNVAATGRG